MIESMLKKIMALVFFAIIFIAGCAAKQNPPKNYYLKPPIHEDINELLVDMTGEQNYKEQESQGDFPVDSMISLRKDLKEKNSGRIMEIYKKYYPLMGPQNILKVIEENPFCHSEGHPLGRLIYQDTEDLEKAMQICRSRCTSGCFHGVLMELISNLINETNDDDLSSPDSHLLLKKEQVEAFMKSFCTKTEVTSRIAVGNCFHALGHAVIFATNYDVESALDYCTKLDNKTAIYFCATGVYMEQDIENGPYVKSGFTYPCEKETRFPAACYRYNVRHLINKSFNSMDIREYCRHLPLKQRLGCFHGLGYAYHKKIAMNSSYLNYACYAGNENDTKLCIDGAIEIVSVYNRSLAMQACNDISNDMKVYCYNTMERKNFNMKKDVGLYYWQ